MTTASRPHLEVGRLYDDGHGHAAAVVVVDDQGV